MLTGFIISSFSDNSFWGSAYLWIDIRKISLFEGNTQTQCNLPFKVNKERWRAAGYSRRIERKDGKVGTVVIQHLYNAIENATNQNAGKSLDCDTPNPPMVYYAYVLCVYLDICSADVSGIIFAHRRPKFTMCRGSFFVFLPALS